VAESPIARFHEKENPNFRPMWTPGQAGERARDQESCIVADGPRRAQALETRATAQLRGQSPARAPGARQAADSCGDMKGPGSSRHRGPYLHREPESSRFSELAPRT